MSCFVCYTNDVALAAAEHLCQNQFVSLSTATGVRDFCVCTGFQKEVTPANMEDVTLAEYMVQ